MKSFIYRTHVTYFSTECLASLRADCNVAGTYFLGVGRCHVEQRVADVDPRVVVGQLDEVARVVGRRLVLGRFAPLRAGGARRGAGDVEGLVLVLGGRGYLGGAVGLELSSFERGSTGFIFFYIQR